jgi:hypothetical protein
MTIPLTIDEEEALYVFNEHWVRYSKAILLFLIGVGANILCVALSLWLHEINHIISMVSIIVGHILLLTFHHAAFYSFLSVSMSQYLVTNKRILGSQQNLWFKDKLIDIPLWRIRSIEVQKKGIGQHIFNYGSLLFNNGDFSVLNRIPDPHAVHTKIFALVQKMQPALERARPANPNA